MANSCSTDHNCKFVNHIVPMFQDMNVVKFVPFTLLAIYQKSMYPPKIFQNPPFWQITQNSPAIFRFEPREMKPSNFTANCVKITQFATHNNESCKIHAILIKSYQSLLLNCTPTFYNKSRKIRPIH